MTDNRTHDTDLPVEVLESIARDYHNRKRRERYARNPDLVLMNREKCAVRLLARTGRITPSTAEAILTQIAGGGC